MSSFINFTGVGNELRVFDESNFTCLDVIEAFPQDAIHGIVNGQDKILVYGGRTFGIFTFEESKIKRLFYHSFTDWIIAADFYSPTDETNISILFAHNNLYFFNYLTKEYKNIWCEEKCILYGGCLSRENSNELVLLSGTVFQEILLWKVNNEEDYKSDVPVLHRLKGHNGVIFSVTYDPIQQLITSTSDDRTIRLWKISSKSKESQIDLADADVDIVTTMFGHTARVWKSMIVKNHVISIGEDSLICIWSLDGQLCNKIIAHGGATIWSIDVSQDETTIFTGGADGAVNSWPFNSGEKSELTPWLSYPNRTPKFVNYLDSGSPIVFIDGGELLTYDPGNSEVKSQILLTRYESYCIMQLSPSRKLIAFASKSGDLTVYQEINNNEWKLQKIIDQKVVESKIFSLQWLDEDMILLCADRGALKIVKLVDKKRVDVFSEYTLPPNKECWTTAAIYINNILICGDRAGSVFVFNFDKNPQQIFFKIHGRLGVQSFGYLGNKLVSTGRDGTLRFYKVHKNPSTCAITLQILHWKKMPMEWGSKIIKTKNDTFILGFKEIEFMIYSCRLDRLILRLVCGGGHRSWDCIFKNNSFNFVCIRDKKVHILNNPSCFLSNSIIPGYHTKEIHSLSFVPTSSKHQIVMSGSEDCTIRISTMRRNNFDKFDLVPLGTFDGHVSNVKSIKIVNLLEDDKVTKNLVFSGGGRAQLFVWEINVRTDQEVICVEDVTMVELTSFMLHGTDKDRRRIMQNQAEDYVMNPETRFMDISIFTSINDKNTIILFVACSDGFVRVFTYNVKTNVIFLSTELTYMNRCIIKIHTFLHGDKLILVTMATDGKINFWDMSLIVDDILSQKDDYCFFENNVVEPFGGWTGHQSGINSFDIKKWTNDEYFFISGGDDNNLNFNVFKIISSQSEEFSIECIAEWSSSTAHSAQITGLKFLGNESILSVAIDQKLITHNWTYDDGILNVKIGKNEPFFIADVQGLELNEQNSNENKINDIIACAYGQGLAMISCQQLLL